MSGYPTVRANLEAIVIRCEEGDPKSDWLPIIARLAREALAALSSEPASTGLDSQLLTDALNAVLRKHPGLAYAGYVYGETGAEVAAEYDRLSRLSVSSPQEPTDG